MPWFSVTDIFYITYSGNDKAVCLCPVWMIMFMVTWISRIILCFIAFYIPFSPPGFCNGMECDLCDYYSMNFPTFNKAHVEYHRFIPVGCRYNWAILLSCSEHGDSSVNFHIFLFGLVISVFMFLMTCCWCWSSWFRKPVNVSTGLKVEPLCNLMPEFIIEY